MSPAFRLVSRMGSVPLSVVDPPDPPPLGDGSLRLGICSAKAGGEEERPIWPDALASLGWANIKARRMYSGPGQSIRAEFRSDIIEAVKNDCVCTVSTKARSAAEWAGIEADLEDWGPYPFILAALHEPAGDISPAGFVEVQHRMLDMISNRRWWHITPMIIWNGFWFSARSAKRKGMMAEGGFDAWWPGALAERFADMDGILGHDTYHDGSPPSPENPFPNATEGPGVRVRNLRAFADGKPWAAKSAGEPNWASPVPIRRIGFGEVGTWNADAARDTFAAFLETKTTVATWFDKSRDQLALEESDPRYTYWMTPKKGGPPVERWGGNPQAGELRKAYLDCIRVAGKPWPIASRPSGV